MNPVRKALRDKLAELDLGNGVFYRIAEGEPEFPYVIFSKQSGMPLHTFADWADNDVWLVKGVGDADDAEDIQEALKTALNRAELTIVGKDHLSLLHISDFNTDETESGETIHHVGSEYRLMSNRA